MGILNRIKGSSDSLPLLVRTDELTHTATLSNRSVNVGVSTHCPHTTWG